MTTLQDACRQTITLCDAGFASYDAGYYNTIADVLRPFETDERVVPLLRMCEAGPTLSSKRFAYPHIGSRAHDILASS